MTRTRSVLVNAVIGLILCGGYVVTVHLRPVRNRWWVVDDTWVYLNAAASLPTGEYRCSLPPDNRYRFARPVGIAAFLWATGANDTSPPYTMIAAHILLAITASVLIATVVGHSPFVLVAMILQFLPFITVIHSDAFGVSLGYIGLGLVLIGVHWVIPAAIVGLALVSKSTAIIFLLAGALWFVLRRQYKVGVLFCVVAYIPVFLWSIYVYTQTGVFTSGTHTLAGNIHSRFIPGLMSGGNPRRHVELVWQTFKTDDETIPVQWSDAQRLEWEAEEVHRLLPGLLPRLPRYLLVNTGYILFGSNQQWRASVDLTVPKWILRPISAILVFLTVVGLYRTWKTQPQLCLVCGLIVVVCFGLTEFVGATLTARHFLPAAGGLALLWDRAPSRSLVRHMTCRRSRSGTSTNCRKRSKRSTDGMIGDSADSPG